MEQMFEKPKGKPADDTVSDLPLAGRVFSDLGRMMRGARQASYTVEASFVMTFTLLVMAFLIRTAYGQYRQSTGTMELHEAVQKVKGQEETEEVVLQSGSWSGQARRDGSKASGTAQGAGWSLEIEASVQDPEAMMRMLTILDAFREPGGGGKE